MMYIRLRFAATSTDAYYFCNFTNMAATQWWRRWRNSAGSLRCAAAATAHNAASATGRSAANGDYLL